MRKSANAVVIFMVAGLIGPLILWATWPPVVVLEKLPSIRRFV